MFGDDLIAVPGRVKAFDAEVAGIAVRFIAVAVHAGRVALLKCREAFIAAEDVAVLIGSQCDVRDAESLLNRIGFIGAPAAGELLLDEVLLVFLLKVLISPAVFDILAGVFFDACDDDVLFDDEDISGFQVVAGIAFDDVAIFQVQRDGAVRRDGIVVPTAMYAMLNPS